MCCGSHQLGVFLLLRLRAHTLRERHTASSFHTNHSSSSKHMWEHTHTRALQTCTSICCIEAWTNVSCKAERENASSVIPGLNKACSLLLFPSFCLPASVNVSFLIHHHTVLPPNSPSISHLVSVCFASFPTLSGAAPLPDSVVPHHCPPVSIHLWLPFPHRVCLVIIPSPPSPSSMKIESRPAHQFALTVNCVENSSGCLALRPGQGFQTDRT